MCECDSESREQYRKHIESIGEHRRIVNDIGEVSEGSEVRIGVPLTSPGSPVLMMDDKNGNPEVHWHSYLSHLAQIIPTFQLDTVDPDFKDTKRSLPSKLQVTGIANPDCHYPHTTNHSQVKALKPVSLWQNIKEDENYYLTIISETRCVFIF